MKTLDFTKYAGTYSLKEAQEVAKQMQAELLEHQKQEDLDQARKQHGDGYTYELRKGTSVNLQTLNSNQRVCASQIKGHHILMTEK